MKPTKVNFYLMLFLVIYWVAVTSLSMLLLKTIIYLIFFYENKKFDFVWPLIIYSSKVGFSAGIPLGIGSWILSKLDERKRRLNL